MTVVARLEGALDGEAGERLVLFLSSCGTPGKASTPALLASTSYLRMGAITALDHLIGSFYVKLNINRLGHV